MKSNRIEEIVRKVYEKAENNCASQSKYALSKHVENHTDLSYRTIQRAFDRYINNLDEGEPSAVTIDIFCNYLGFENYADFRGQTVGVEGKKDKWNKKFVMAGGIVLVFISGVIFYLKQPEKNKTISAPVECMIWSKTHYEKISCDKRLGKVVERYDPVKLENFKKIEVSLTTPVFDEDTGLPLVWYYKTRAGDIEFYTAPGTHPITNKTLKAVTTYIIEKYVPKHEFNADSFLEE